MNETDFDGLSLAEQQKYFERAAYLINNGYVEDDDVEELARKIYKASLDQP